MLKAAERVNKQRIDRFFDKIHKALWVIKGKKIAVLGLAFKANTDDIRFAPALDVIRRLLDEGAEVHATDPEAISRTKPLLPPVKYHEDPYEALKGVDAALVCTEWQVFRNLDWEKAGQAWRAGWLSTGEIFTHRRKCRSWDSTTTRLDVYNKLGNECLPGRRCLFVLLLEKGNRRLQPFFQTHFRFPVQ